MFETVISRHRLDYSVAQRTPPPGPPLKIIVQKRQIPTLEKILFEDKLQVLAI